MNDELEPYGEDDHAARERAARRAERDRRRAERQRVTQASLGERVKEQQAGSDPAVTGASAAEAAPKADTAPPAGPPPASADRPHHAPPPPPRGALYRRRVVTLLGIGALAFVALVVVVIARGGSGGEEPAAVEPATAQKTTELVIPEGLSRMQIAELLKEEGVRGDYEEETTSARGFNPSKYGAEAAGDLEGFLFPATYDLFRKDDARDLVAKQLEAFEENFSEVDLDYAKSKNLTPYDVIKIASMIEREIALPEERKLAAAVIYNRLSDGMPLGIDATIRYATGNYDEPLKRSELALESPYNTRINTGLPPGPIGNPGLASIEAAAKPAKSDVLYYVIKPGTCNEHFFTDSEKRFQAAADEYQAALEAEGDSPTQC